MTFDAGADVLLAVTAAKEAGRLVRARFGTALPVRYKAADQPVTAADREADARLREILLGERPTYGWISEESETVRGEGPSWLVDPLDGTSNFVAGRPGFAVGVALLGSGTTLLGVVYNPLTGEEYRAVAGAGAWRDGARLTAAVAPPERPRLAVSPGELERGAFAGLDPAAWELVPLGSTTLKMVAVAAGDVDGYLSSARKGPWDVCAGALIAEEAGARVLRRDGTPFRPDASVASIDGIMVLAPSVDSRVSVITRSVWSRPESEVQ